MANDYTDFVPSFRFKQIPKNDHICIAINQVTPIPRVNVAVPVLQNATALNKRPSNTTLIAPSASRSSLASSKTLHGQAALQRFWFRVGSSFRAIDFDHVPDLPFFIARVAEILEIDAGDLYLLKYGFSVSSASFDNDLLNRSDRLYDVRVRLRGGQDQEAPEGARIAPTPMYLPPPFFLGTDQTPTLG